MNSFGKIAAVALVILLSGCEQRDRKIKAHFEEDYERFHEQMEKERTMDAYRRSPAYKAKVIRDLRHGMFGSSEKKGKVIP
jgi:hypothetical protein